jgi:hypothetical protein
VSFTIPGGKDKGVSIEDADIASINYWLDRKRNETNPRFADSNAAWIAAAEAELARRSGAPPADDEPPPGRFDDDHGDAWEPPDAEPVSEVMAGPAPKRQRTAEPVQARQQAPRGGAEIVRRSTGELSASYTNADQAREALARAQRDSHVLSPMVMGRLPAGCEMAIVARYLDPVPAEEGGTGDVYRTKSKKLALQKSALEAIAVDAGLSWIPEHTRQISPRSDKLVTYSAAAIVRGFDGREMIVGPATASVDTESMTRDGVEMARRMTETKAKLRVIRSALGIKAGYTAEELRKPFVIASVQFTGRCPENPALERVFAEKMAEQFLNGSRRLYAPAPLPQLPTYDVDDDGAVE